MLGTGSSPLSMSSSVPSRSALTCLMRESAHTMNKGTTIRLARGLSGILMDTATAVFACAGSPVWLTACTAVATGVMALANAVIR